MKRYNRLFSLIVLLISPWLISPWAAAQEQGDIAAGKESAFTCMGCHGQQGMRNAYPGYRVPKLGGQSAQYISIALKAYRDGERIHPTMQGHAASLSDEDIVNISSYFASIEDN